MLTNAAKFPVLLVAALALSVAPPQDPAKKPEPRRPAAAGTVEDAERIRRELIGTWQLVRADMLGAVFGGGDCEGYLLVSEGCLAIEMHFRLPSNTLFGSDEVAFTSGLHRWNYDEKTLKLETSALIGMHNDNPDLDVQFTQRGAQRTYDVTVAAQNVTLTRDARTRFEFARIGKLPYPGNKPR